MNKIGKSSAKDIALAVKIEFSTTAKNPIVAQSIMKSIVAACKGEECRIKGLNIILGDDKLLQQLNRDFSDLDDPTDVLAFDLGDGVGEAVEGDIYISLDRATAQAAERGDSTTTETVRLAIHGFLHLCGWDHDDDASLEAMVERGEKYIVVQQEGS